MEGERARFYIAVVTGFVVMILFAAFTVNIHQSIPLVSPFAGGLVAGLVAGGEYMNGGRAGVIAGLLGAVAVAVDIMTETALLSRAVPQFPELAGFLYLVVAVLYFPILAFIGGAIGGAIRR